jgi:polar amino acid transport system substrate-binding protein
MRLLTGLIAATLALLVALPAPLHADESLARVLAAGKLRIGVSLTAPWTMKEEEGGYMGFEADLSRRLAYDLGVEAAFVELPFDGLLPALLRGEVDIVAAGLTITPARARDVVFTIPTNMSHVDMVYRMPGGEEAAPDPLAPGYRIAVLSGSSDLVVAHVHFPEAVVTGYPTMDEALAALLDGKADALVASSPVPAIAVASFDAELALAEEEPLAVQADALALRPDDVRLLLYLNNWLTAREADGFLESLRTYYFDGLDWMEGMPHRAAE